MREGRPVVWLFVLFIIICYVGVYINNIHEERDRYYNIAVDQDIVIKEQQEAIMSLKEYMILYMRLPREDPGLYKRNSNDPINRPI